MRLTCFRDCSARPAAPTGPPCGRPSRWWAVPTCRETACTCSAVSPATACRSRRSPDPADRRRLTVSLTERGALAAQATRSAVERVDAALANRVGAEDIRRTRATLAALIDLGRSPED